jgi:hypothetical protein
MKNSVFYMKCWKKVLLKSAGNRFHFGRMVEHLPSLGRKIQELPERAGSFKDRYQQENTKNIRHFFSGETKPFRIVPHGPQLTIDLHRMIFHT